MRRYLAPLVAGRAACQSPVRQPCGPPPSHSFSMRHPGSETLGCGLRNPEGGADGQRMDGMERLRLMALSG
ncbi:unnamed protein product [Boreogadus saida]